MEDLILCSPDVVIIARLVQTIPSSLHHKANSAQGAQVTPRSHAMRTVRSVSSGCRLISPTRCLPFHWG
ncbi:hypothetical protein I7I50_05275 [Histoplasma capsulatum G186AR]|uniref:Uncharacterized protein n=1 Tax=Ajellomyces capsulatus TaxID=5037 RepID=A0A8H7ZB09_AJECA|nr:hypothetical protein I7I52_03534 [Histoplasma capsulatum]QSS75966.1 hypothetical protein I7I50_05275 [Histoplasma capsulatum G186AR]